MRMSVLGPLLIHNGREIVTPSAPKPRKVAALLLLNANKAVPVGALFRELWDSEPPLSAHTTLQTYILHLRRQIGGNYAGGRYRQAKDILATQVGGCYLFRAEPGELDLAEYHRMAAAGAQALAGRHWHEAAGLLQEARTLWQGPALVDVPAGRVLGPLIMGLEESHMTVTEQYLEVQLRLGRHLDILGELTALAAEHRFHENLHTQLMLALHRSGRRQDALSVFDRIRGALVTELGLEPSQRLRSMQAAILADDPGLRLSAV